MTFVRKAAVGFVFFALVAAGSGYAFVQSKMPKLSTAAESALSQPDSAEILYLAPKDPLQESQPVIGRWGIVKSVPVPKGKEGEASGWLRSLYVMAPAGAKCFDPHHALRVKKGERRSISSSASPTAAPWCTKTASRRRRSTRGWAAILPRRRWRFFPAIHVEAGILGPLNCVA